MKKGHVRGELVEGVPDRSVMLGEDRRLDRGANRLRLLHRSYNALWLISQIKTNACVQLPYLYIIGYLDLFRNATDASKAL